jgi:hypothetical protein
MIGGLGKRDQGGIVNPSRNRKGETGSPPPNANASEFYPNRNPLGRAGGILVGEI